MKLLITILALMLALVACTPKEEAPEMTETDDAKMASQPVALFDQLDADADGQIDMKEHQAHTESWLARWDANGDNQLDAEEQYVWLDTVFDTVAGDLDDEDEMEADDDDDEYEGEEIEGEDDLDPDDYFSREQMLAFAIGDCVAEPVHPQVKTPLYVFAHIDADEDGALTKPELKGYIMTRFEMLDADHDGMVSEVEFFDLRKQELADIDADSDGNITAEELMKARYGEM